MSIFRDGQHGAETSERAFKGDRRQDRKQRGSMERDQFIRNDAGFTLLEVMFATLILAMGLIGMMAMQMSAIQGNDYGMKMTEAAERIETRMEAIRMMPYESIQSEAEEADADGFTRTTTVQDHTPQTGVKTVEVRVSWQDHENAKTHAIAFHTIVME
jgi:type IV pilus assembly protein PilV